MGTWGPLILLAFIAQCSASSLSPLLIWSNTGIVGNQPGSQVLYDVLGAEELASSIVQGAAGQPDALSSKLLKPTTDLHSAVIVYAGRQVDASSLRMAGPSSKLQALLEPASSSMVVPFSKLQGSSLPDSLMSSLALLSGDSISVQTVGCVENMDDEDLVQEVAKAAQQLGKVQVVLICPRASDEPGTSPAGLDSEIQQLMAIQEAVEAADRKYIFVYASHSATLPSQGRSLLAKSPPPPPPRSAGYYGFGDYTSCGTLCQTQVRWLEGMLSIIFLALASGAGLTCLLVLNTPTRFEALKDTGAVQ